MNGSPTEAMLILLAGVHSIPEPVLSLNVKIHKKGARLDAVLVVEHRNVLDVRIAGSLIAKSCSWLCETFLETSRKHM